MQIQKGDKIALLFGATGLVGGHCLNELLDSDAYSKVIIFNRRKLNFDHPKLEEHLIDFNDLDKISKLISGNDCFCCLGTTIAKAGSKEAFQKVDFIYPYRIAVICQQNGVSQFILVSAIGANAESSIFYNRVKGDLERALKKLSFWGLHIFQPALLLGERNETRIFEGLAQNVSKGINLVAKGLFGKYSPVEAKDVAMALVRVAQLFRQGKHVYRYDDIQSLAKGDFEKMEIKN